MAASHIQKDEELAHAHPYADIDFDRARERNNTVPGYLINLIPNRSAQSNEQYTYSVLAYPPGRPPRFMRLYLPVRHPGVNFAHASCKGSDPLMLASAKKDSEGISVLPRNRRMNAVTEEIDSATARSLDSSAMEETSSMLLERRATIVGMKARIEAPEDHRAGKSLGTLLMMQRSVV